MSMILSLPEELIIEIMVKGDHRMLMACQRTCRTFNNVIKESLALQYIILLAACGMQDGLSRELCQNTAERLQRLREHEAAWREMTWTDGGVITHNAACDLPTAISGGVLAFLRQSDGEMDSTEHGGDRLFLMRVPSKLRGIPGESWELNGLGEMFNLCIDSAQDLLLFHRAGNFHVRALSSGKVHPLVLHSGAFEMGMGTSLVLAESPVVCCDHLAAIVHDHAWSQTTLAVKVTVVVWNWRTGSKVAVFRPYFALICRDIAFLDETHLLIPASATDSTLKPGQDYEIMLIVYNFQPSTTAAIDQVVMTPYCFHITLPVRTGITTFRHVRIGVNTASFSPPGISSPQGFFHTDPKDRIITLEVTDNNWMQGTEAMAELYVPVRTFLAYIAAHPPTTTTATTTTAADFSPSARTRGPVVDVPWEAWGPHGAHVVRAADQTYIIRRPRACGMRVLGASLSRKSVVVTDYHLGRVARSTKVGVGTVLATNVATATSSTTHARTPSSFMEQWQRGTQVRRPALVWVTKEVPLPRELRDASESPWTMLCEDALLAFEYVPDGFEISRVFAYTF